jgi:ParB/RepB/Spo0J family partition protein
MAGKKVAGVMHFLDSLGAGAKADEAAPPVVAVTTIAPDPGRQQPRTEFDQEALENLAESIREAGIIQALTVRPSGMADPAYYIIDGERRWRAATIAGLQEVPVLIRLDINDDASFQFAVQVMANAQAAQLSDYELARAIKQIVGDEGARHGIKKKIAAMTNRTSAQVSRLLAMLDADIEPLVHEGLLRSAATVAAFNALDAATQARLVVEARDRGEALSTSELREASKKPKESGTSENDTPDTADRQNSTGDLPPADVETGNGSAAPDSASSSTVDPDDDDDTSNNAGTGAAGSTSNSSTTPPNSGRQSEPGATRDKPIKLKLTAEKVESLFRFFVDKSTDKIDVSIPRDLAIAVLENMGIELPDDVDAYATRIKDFLD